MESEFQSLTVEEVANFLKVSPQYVRSLIRTKKLPAEMRASTWFIPKLVLEDPEVMMKILPDVKDQKCKMKIDKSLIALSFFSGAMGLDQGLKAAGIEVILASEIEPDARKTIISNYPEIGLIGDINDYSASQIRDYANITKQDKIHLVIGGPPCQAFSTAGKREGFNDNRGNVFLTFIEKAIELDPEFIVIENVRGLLSAPLKHRPHLYRGNNFPELNNDEKTGGALSFVIHLLESGGYNVSFNLYNAANFGSPQKRERVVIICSKRIKNIPFLTPTHSEKGEFGLPHWRTFREVASDLVESNQLSIKFPEKRLKYYRMLKEGQYWKHLPKEIQQEAMGASYFSGGGKTGFLRRIAWDKPAPTLVTNPAMPATDLAHPVQDRPLSIQEYKRVQEFSDDYKIFGTILSQYKQVGNAVPRSLGLAIAKCILSLLDGSKERSDFKDFNFSRYKGTDHISFKKSKIKKEKELSLFS
jgi:DNA (cytosine-5)-methyltransferase 1